MRATVLLPALLACFLAGCGETPTCEELEKERAAQTEKARAAQTRVEAGDPSAAAEMKDATDAALKAKHQMDEMSCPAAGG